MILEMLFILYKYLQDWTILTNKGYNKSIEHQTENEDSFFF